MLTIHIPAYEAFDNRTNRFYEIKGATLRLEHSLISLARWEEKWEKPYLGNDERTMEQCLDYVRCMTLTPNVDPAVYQGLTNENLKEIDDYIKAPMTATWFNEQDNKRFSREVITAEIIYYWMVALNIPFECEKWHLNKLLTLIRVCNIKNDPKKNKRESRSAMMARRSALNKSRRAKHGTHG